MIKALMVDVDGVLIVHPNPGGWIANLERDIGIPATQLQTAFFLPHWHDVIHGRAALRERLAPVLETLTSDVTCDELIEYWFDHDAHVNQGLLVELAALRSGATEVHLATVQEHERAHYLWYTLDFRRSFDRMHYAAELGWAKPHPRFYESIEARTGFRAGELFLIDDRIENVEGAQRCGWAAALWTGRDSVRSLLARHSP